MDLEPIVESGLLAAALRGIVSLWCRWRQPHENEITTLRVDTPQGSNLTIIVIVPRTGSGFAVVAGPRDSTEDPEDLG